MVQDLERQIMSEEYHTFSDSPFAERFSLLLSSGQVQLPILNVVMKMINFVEIEFGIELTEDNAEMFVSHIALALQRIANGESIKEAPSALMNEAQALTEYWNQSGILTQIASEALDQEIPQSEHAYLTLHLATLMHNTRK